MGSTYIRETGELSSQQQFIQIVVAVSLVTFSQGLFIPLLATLQSGHTDAVLNSLGTTILYTGLVLAMFVVESVLRRIGMRNTVVWALCLGVVVVFLFGMTENIWLWFVFRFLFGLCLGTIHYTTQTWLGKLTNPNRRGRQMAVYGMATGIGFSIGPLCLNTISWSPAIPFILTGLALTSSVALIYRLPNSGLMAMSAEQQQDTSTLSTSQLYRRTLPAVFMPFVFGFMESTLNGDLPLYAKEVGLPLPVMSMGLAAFVMGSLVLQYPLGCLSDRWGKRKILTGCSLIGAVIFAMTPFVDSAFGFTMTFALAGGFVGTLFSLSLAFLCDLVPSDRLHQANRLAMILFGTGMTLGPFLAGGAITWLMPDCLFWLISALYLLYVVMGLHARRTIPLTEELPATSSAKKAGT